MVWASARELSVGAFVVVPPNVYIVTWKKLFGPPARVDVAVDVVVMWLVRDSHSTVVFGSSPVFAATDLVVAIGSCLNDGEHVR